MKKFKDIVIFISLILLIAAFSGILINLFSGKKDTAVFILTYNGKIVVNNTDLGIVESPSTFNIQGSGDYTITIFAAESDKDFALNIRGSQYYWNDFSNTDFTDSFNVEKSSGLITQSFTMSYGNIADIIYSKVGYKASIGEERGDAKFKIIVSGTNTVTYYITIPSYIQVDKVILPESIIL